MSRAPVFLFVLLVGTLAGCGSRENSLRIDYPMGERVTVGPLTYNVVETVLGTEADPKLPPGKMDLILLVDVYHEFSQPQKMLRKIFEALKPDGRLVLLEYRKEDPTIPIRPEHKMSIQEVKTELEAEGFHLSQVIETLPRQHIIILTKAAQ